MWGREFFWILNTYVANIKAMIPYDLYICAKLLPNLLIKKKTHLYEYKYKYKSYGLFSVYYCQVSKNHKSALVFGEKK